MAFAPPFSRVFPATFDRRAAAAAASSYNLAFNGATSIMNCGSGASIDNLHDGAMTAELWINPDATGTIDNEQYIYIGKTGWYLYKVFGSQVIRARIICATTNGQSQASIAPGSWYHVAMTWDDATFQYPKLWINGSDQSSSTQNRSNAIVSDAANDLVISDLLGVGTNRYHGLLGWARLSNVVRYTSAFTPIARCSPPTTDANTVALWRLTEGAGNPQDASGNANHGTLTNVTWSACS